VWEKVTVMEKEMATVLDQGRLQAQEFERKQEQAAGGRSR
jgi:hypothetical protein